MMREIPKVRQIPGEGRRRWFVNNDFDLIIWYEDEMIFGFQLCYDPHGKPRAYTWTRTKGSHHHGIDDGDDLVSGYKATPILVTDGEFDALSIEPKFHKASKSLPQDIRSIVLKKIKEEKAKPPTKRPSLSPGSPAQAER